ncbi:MAG: carboxypeptidase regulatory-like domain-containing protein, partial [Gemmatimonadetes bacterium]|nr:carboxypeptidase regulatory-like domain-containing protein [Gemmatimonadota bacterium]
MPNSALPGRRRRVAGSIVAFALLASGLPAAGQTLVGTVRGGDPETPLAGAHVRLLGPDHAVLRSVRTDEEGHFRIDTEGTDGAWLFVEAPGFASSLSDPLPRGGAGFTDASVRLAPLGQPTEAVAVVEAPD